VINPGLIVISENGQALRCSAHRQAGKAQEFQKRSAKAMGKMGKGSGKSPSNSRGFMALWCLGAPPLPLGALRRMDHFFTRRESSCGWASKLIQEKTLYYVVLLNQNIIVLH
jgi:hypothetical protein